jgi:hypothetical protein
MHHPANVRPSRHYVQYLFVSIAGVDDDGFAMALG